MNPIILIPSRLAATRLPGKPLELIAGKPMIVHVSASAQASNVGITYVATDTQEIADVVSAADGNAILTRAEHVSGSDRIYEALQKVDSMGEHDIIINVQGDMPTLDPKIIQEVLNIMGNQDVDIGTLAAIITDQDEINDPAVVKAKIEFANPRGPGRAIDFTRSKPPGGKPYFHHIGIYAYRRAALEHFISLPPSPREKSEKLEQLRALENGMRIDVAVVDTVPLGVDTPETLEKARKAYE